MRRFCKLNSTYHSKLRGCSISSTAAIYIAAMAAVHEPQYTETIFLTCVLRLVYCRSYIFEGSIAAVDKPQYRREEKSLSITAACVLQPLQLYMCTVARLLHLLHKYSCRSTQAKVEERLIFSLMH